MGMKRCHDGGVGGERSSSFLPLHPSTEAQVGRGKPDRKKLLSALLFEFVSGGEMWLMLGLLSGWIVVGIILSPLLGRILARARSRQTYLPSQMPIGSTNGREHLTSMAHPLPPLPITRASPSRRQSYSNARMARRRE